jgi:hypothetical protein
MTTSTICTPTELEPPKYLLNTFLSKPVCLRKTLLRNLGFPPPQISPNPDTPPLAPTKRARGLSLLPWWTIFLRS